MIIGSSTSRIFLAGPTAQWPIDGPHPRPSFVASLGDWPTRCQLVPDCLPQVIEGARDHRYLPFDSEELHFQVGRDRLGALSFDSCQPRLRFRRLSILQQLDPSYPCDRLDAFSSELRDLR